MSSLPARYESFLISNSSTIATIESSLRSLTWFLPGRFKDAEIVSEALTSTLNLLSLYHDTLLARRLQLVKSSLPKSAINSYSELIPPSAHSRYTRAWSEKDAVYKWSARGLEVLRFMQLVLEMLLKRFTGRNARWRGIFLLELTKALLRLLLLQRTKRPILSPSIPERDVDPASLPALIDLAPSSPPLKPNNTSIDESTESTTTTQTSSTVPTHLSNNHVPFNSSGKPHPLLSSLQSVPLTRTIIEDYLLPKALTPSLVKSPTTLLPQIQGVGQWLSEILYILRPLIYVSMLRPTTQNLVKGTTSINYNTQSSLHSLRTPLAVSLLLSLLSRHLRPKPPVSPSSATSLERLEYARRDKELFWNVFRGEIWTEWTRPKLEGLRTRMEGRPLVGLLSGVVQDWMWLVDEYYYYTAT